MRRQQLHRHALHVEPETVALHLQALIDEAVRGSSSALEVMLAWSLFAHTADAKEQLALDAIDLKARAAELHGVSWLLLGPPPARHVDRLLFRQVGKPLTLGERKSLAAQSNPRALERLVLDVEPMVIERLLSNPRLQESHVMTIVSRRPTSPQLLDTVVTSHRWYSRHRIREALAQNPYVETGVALRVLPTLNAQALQRIRNGTELHQATRLFAEYLLMLRRGELSDAPTPHFLDQLDS